MGEGVQKVTVSFDQRPEVSVDGDKKKFSPMEINGRECNVVKLDENTYARLKSRPEGKYDLILQRFDGKPLDTRNVTFHGGTVSKVRVDGDTYKAKSPVDLSPDKAYDFSDVNKSEAFVRRDIRERSVIESTLKDRTDRRQNEIRGRAKKQEMLTLLEGQLAKFQEIRNPGEGVLDTIAGLEQQIREHKESIEGSTKIIAKFESEISILREAESPRENAVRRLDEANSAKTTLDEKIAQVMKQMDELDAEFDTLLKNKDSLETGDLNEKLDAISEKKTALFAELGRLNKESDALEDRISRLEQLVAKEKNMEKLRGGVQSFVTLKQEIENPSGQISNIQFKEMQLGIFFEDIKQSLEALQEYFTSAVTSHQGLGNKEEALLAQTQLLALGLVESKDPDADLLKINENMERIQDSFVERMEKYKEEGNISMYRDEALKLHAMMGAMVNTLNGVFPAVTQSVTRTNVLQRLTRGQITVNECIKQAGKFIESEGKSTAGLNGSFDELNSFLTGEREKKRALKSIGHRLDSARTRAEKHSLDSNTVEDTKIHLSPPDYLNLIETLKSLFDKNRFEESYALMKKYTTEQIQDMGLENFMGFMINLASAQSRHPDEYPIT